MPVAPQLPSAAWSLRCRLPGDHGKELVGCVYNSRGDAEITEKKATRNRLNVLSACASGPPAVPFVRLVPVVYHRRFFTEGFRGRGMACKLPESSSALRLRVATALCFRKWGGREKHEHKRQIVRMLRGICRKLRHFTFITMCFAGCPVFLKVQFSGPMAEGLGMRLTSESLSYCQTGLTACFKFRIKNIVTSSGQVMLLGRLALSCGADALRGLATHQWCV